MEETLHVKSREAIGSKPCRKLRKEGFVPAVLYGHGEDVVNLQIPTTEIDAMLRHGSRMVTLEGDVNDTAMVHDLQWDTFGLSVMHIDFARVSLSERVEVEVPVVLVGVAPGEGEGGIVDHLIHSVTLEVPARDVPENVTLDINELHLGDSISLGKVSMPASAKVVGDAEEAAVSCVHPPQQPEAGEEGAEAAGGEPEVIGEEGGSDSDSE